MKHVPYTRDLQDDAALFRCCICQGEIYAGERYYQVDDGAICFGCLILHARRVFLPSLHIAEAELPEEAGE